MNRGNSGQRYKMPKAVGAEKTAEGNILIKLSCGHTYTIIMVKESNVDDWLGWAQERVQKGKKQRCNTCEVDSDAR